MQTMDLCVSLGLYVLDFDLYVALKEKNIHQEFGHQFVTKERFQYNFMSEIMSYNHIDMMIRAPELSQRA